MNCSDFKTNWHGLITNSIDASTRGAMAAHAKVCKDCDSKWSLQQEVDGTLQKLVDSQPLPPNVAEDAANHAYQSRFGAAINFGNSEGPSVQSQQGLFWPRKFALLIAFAAAVFGYLLGSGRNEPNRIQQLYNAQMAYGGRGGSPFELMMLSEMSGIGGTSQGYLPAVTSTVQVLCLATILVWVTRSNLWGRVFPAKLPAGLHAARWLGLIAALVGIARSAGWAYAGFTVRSMRGGGGMSGDASWISNSLTVVDQLWGIGFWLTVIVLVMTVVEKVVQGMIGPMPADR